MFKKLSMKPFISLFLTMVLLLSFTIPTFASETFSSGEISSKICAKIIDALDFVSLEKDKYGLADVDFDAISVGNPIHSYEYTNERLGEILAGYPLFSGWTNSSGVSHACVICGINAISGYITVMDPEYGFCSASTNGSTYYFYSLYNGIQMTLVDYGSSIR